MSTATDSVWMTPAALAALEDELRALDATELSEQDALRAVELRSLIRRAETGAKPDDGLVEPGMVITVRFADGDEDTFLLGTRGVTEAPDSDLDVYSATSPLGVAIAGRYVGDTVSYTAPSGAEITVEVVAAAPFA